MNHPDDILAALKQVKYDLSVTQTRIDEAMRAVAALPREASAEHKCPACGVSWRSARRLEEHLYNSHAGPVPEHYLAAERLAGIQA